MNPPILPGATEPYKDRKTGLIVFGIFTALLGGLCALFIPLMIFGQAMAPQASAASAKYTILPAIVIYGSLAVALVWLGIGSMIARRWARALLLIFSWSWLIMGLISMVTMAIMLPQIANATQPPGQTEGPPVAIFMLIQMIFSGIFFVGLPAVWVFFYRSRHVKATCEALDPLERWTDRCPLPVLAICIWMGFTALMMLATAGAFRGVIPVFGLFLTGPAGTAVYLLLAGVWAYSTWSLYRLEWRGWWIIVTSIAIFSVSAFVTYSQHDISELYTLMGYPKEMIAQMQQFNFMKGSAMAWMSVAGAIPFLGYLFYLRKYLPHPEETSATAAS